MRITDEEFKTQKVAKRTGSSKRTDMINRVNIYVKNFTTQKGTTPVTGILSRIRNIELQKKMNKE